MRLVPLIASATETIHALGLGAYQVGRSHECDYPPEVESLPVCTKPRIDISGSSREIDQRVKAILAQAESVYEVFRERLDKLEPTHIFTQTQCEVCAVSVKDVELAMSGQFHSRPLVVALEPNTLDDVFGDIRRIADSCGVPERGTQLVARLHDRLEEFRGAATGIRLALLEWIDPVMYAAHWMPEMIAITGAELVTLEDDPDAIIAAPCGWDVPKAREEMRSLARQPGWRDLKAVRSGRVFAADGNQYFNRPGPRVVESVRIVVEFLRSDP